MESNNIETNVPVRRGRVDFIILYEVKEHELEALENGEPVSLHLNFGVALLSIGLSFLVTLCSTTTYKSPIWEYFFLFTAIITILGGIIFLISWIVKRKSIKSVIQTIKARVTFETVSDISGRTESPTNPPDNMDIITPPS